MESPHLFRDKDKKGLKEKKYRLKRIRAVKLYKTMDGHFCFKITTTTDAETNRSLAILYSADDRKMDNYVISSLTINLDRFIGRVVDIICKKITYDFYSSISGESTRICGRTIRVMELYATSTT